MDFGVSLYGHILRLWATTVILLILCLNKDVFSPIYHNINVHNKMSIVVLHTNL